MPLKRTKETHNLTSKKTNKKTKTNISKLKINKPNKTKKATEAMFYPHLIGSQAMNLFNLTYNCIDRCDIDMKNEISKHVVLAGGNTQFSGMVARLEKELKKIKESYNNSKTQNKFKVEDPSHSNRKNMVCVGGCILAEIMKEENSFWLNYDLWLEYGTERAIKQHFKK